MPDPVLQGAKEIYAPGTGRAYDPNTQTEGKQIMDPKKKKRIKCCLFCLLGGAIYSAGVSIFAKAAAFAPGGVSGVAIIINHLVPQLPIGLLSILINVPVILLTFKNLGRHYLINSIVTMVFVAFCMDYVWTLVPEYEGEALLAALFAGVLSGTGLSFIYLHGSCAGGTDFITMSLKKKYPFRSVGTYATLVDGTVILLGGLVFGNINAILHGAVMMGANTITMDKLMFGAGLSKQVSIITDKGEDVAAAIRTEMRRGVTLVRAIGTYSMQEHSMLLCNCSPAEVYAIRDLCLRIDPAAFITITTNDAVYGIGFRENTSDI